MCLIHFVSETGYREVPLTQKDLLTDVSSEVLNGCLRVLETFLYLLNASKRKLLRAN